MNRDKIESLDKQLNNIVDTIDDVILANSDTFKLNFEEKNSLYRFKNFLFAELCNRLRDRAPTNRLHVIEPGDEVLISHGLKKYVSSMEPTNPTANEKVKEILEQVITNLEAK